LIVKFKKPQMIQANKRLFSAMQTRVAIVGAGPSGHSLSAQLMNSQFLKAGDVTVFDPSHQHHYQPAYTMVGGGVIGNAKQAKQKEDTYIIKSQQSMF
jgi:flavin-dependent dehydrogenase